MMKRLIAFVLAGLFMVAQPAAAYTEAGEAYVYPTFAELTQTTVMLGGVDLRDNVFLDEYIKLMYCELYRENHLNDFAWHGIEKQILARVQSKKEYFRSLFQVGGVIMIGQYDFQNQQFPLTRDTAFQNVGYMSLFSPQDYKPYCVDPGMENSGATLIMGPFAPTVNILLNEPFNFTALKMKQKEAERLLTMMTRAGTEQERKLYIRFRFRVQSVAETKKRSADQYSQTDLGGEIVGIDLFYDKEMTKWMMKVPMH